MTPWDVNETATISTVFNNQMWRTKCFCLYFHPEKVKDVQRVAILYVFIPHFEYVNDVEQFYLCSTFQWSHWKASVKMCISWTVSRWREKSKRHRGRRSVTSHQEHAIRNTRSVKVQNKPFNSQQTHCCGFLVWKSQKEDWRLSAVVEADKPTKINVSSSPPHPGWRQVSENLLSSSSLTLWKTMKLSSSLLHEEFPIQRGQVDPNMTGDNIVLIS